MERTREKTEGRFLKIADKVVLAVFLVMAAAIASGFIYRSVTNSGRYQEGQARKEFQELEAKVKDAEGIMHIAIDRIDSGQQFIYDVPEKLFEDLVCAGYSRVTEEEKQREISKSDVVIVVYEDESYSIFHITEEGEVYWNYLKMNCPSLVEWYSSYAGL